MPKKNRIKSSWIDRRAAMQHLADLTRDAESWTAAERAQLEACKADLQIATLEAVESALQLADPLDRYAALHGLYLQKDQPKEAAAYARLEAELLERREEREHARQIAALEYVDDVQGYMAAELEALPAADLLALQRELTRLLKVKGEKQ